MLIVQKFGGSSVADKDRVYNVANRVIESYRAGHKVVVVVSAQGDTTDELIEKAMEISASPIKRELDALKATGEQQSAALLAMAINELGCPAISLNAFQVGIHSTSTYGNARFRRIDTERVEAELENKRIVVVAGFQGVNRLNDLTTLGRGASDTTAVALAAVLNADLCEIYTDVDGIYTADPRVVKTARKLSEISYDEMLELASLGAKVLHNRSVELAKKYNIKLVVRSSLTREAGTIVKEDSKMEKMFVSGLALDKNVSRVSVIGIKDIPGKAFALFSLLAKNKISVDVILQSIGRDGQKDISFTVSKDDLQAALEIIQTENDNLQYQSIVHDDKIAKLSIVGAGMATNPGVASIMFEALYDAGVNISMISTSEIKISVLIDVNDAENAARAVHDKFHLVDQK